MKTDRSLVDRRKFHFGRRDQDRKQADQELKEAEMEHIKLKLNDDVEIIIRTLPANREYREKLVAKLQQDGYFVLPSEKKEVAENGRAV